MGSPKVIPKAKHSETRKGTAKEMGFRLEKPIGSQMGFPKDSRRQTGIMTGSHLGFHSGFRMAIHLEIPTRWAIMTGSPRGIPMAIPRGFRMAIRSGTPKAIRNCWATDWGFRRARRLKTHSG